MPKGCNSVAPVDLLSLGVCPTSIGDRHLINACVPLRQSRGDFRLEPELVRREMQRARQITANRLVAGLHVGEVEIRQLVAEGGEHRVAHRVPEVEHAMRPAKEARAEAGVRLSLDDRLQHGGPILRIVLEVGILDDDDVARARGERGTNRLALSTILWLGDEAIDEARGVQLDETLARAVGGTVIDADDLLLHWRRVHTVENRLDRVALIEDWNQNREAKGALVERRQLARLRGEREAGRGNRGH